MSSALHENAIVGHCVRIDAVGWTITHPIACRVARPAAECPVFRAMQSGAARRTVNDERGEFRATLFESTTDGPFVVLQRIDRARPIEFAHEIHDLLDAYADQVGTTLAGEPVAKFEIGEWLKRRYPDG